MEKSIKGTRTEKNLLASFAGESQARNRYTFFASVAKKEGYEQIAAIFLETAEQEREHAKTFFKFLEGGMVEITAMYPAGVIGTTMENLAAAADGENEEHTVLYPEAANIAEEEGFPTIAAAFRHSLAKKKLCGSAVTVVMCLPRRKHPQSAPLVSIRRLTSSPVSRTTNQLFSSGEAPKK